MAQLVVEVRDSHRRVQGYYPIDRFPLSIGRGYDNDIILSDTNVCARHLLIDADQQGWLVRDLDSKNGLHHSSGQQSEMHLDSGDEVVIGKTHLRFFLPEHPVAGAKNLHEKTGVVEALRALAIVWTLMSILVLTFAINDYMTLSQEAQTEKLIAGTLPVVIGVLIWAGAWSLLAYIVRRRLYFYYFLAVSVVYVLLDVLLEVVISIVSFNIVNIWISEALSFITGGILLAALFYASMHQAFSISSRRKLLLANIFSWGLVAVIVFVVYANRSDFDHNPEYPGELNPPLTRIAPLVEFDKFMDKTELMLNKIDN